MSNIIGIRYTHGEYWPARHIVADFVYMIACFALYFFFVPTENLPTNLKSTSDIVTLVLEKSFCVCIYALTHTYESPLFYQKPIDCYYLCPIWVLSIQKKKFYCSQIHAGKEYLLKVDTLKNLVDCIV